MSFISTTARKKMLTIAGLIWFGYVIVHMLSLLNFHFGATAFNGFYDWFNNSPVYWLVLLTLVVALSFHVFIAVLRQLNNNTALGVSKYRRHYPKAIPRFVAWSGASMLLAFIIFHFVQMQLLEGSDRYQQMLDIFSQPSMLIVYALGLMALGAHLHHALSNVLQTLGVSSKTYHLLVILVVLLIVVGLVSIPVSIMYA
ncbi:MAG: hypothetical protein ISR74_05550 [Candidatus Thioglobus sp.]|nr:hypothetical protein [Candidatus Brocadiales bacterium]MBL6985044.1 hypothetical protein [Candidatus Thioglobus sp.]MBL7003745.1 hypothetical protein [Gammaproteobacteria bacterium]